jgi:hypothetical protein
MNINKTAELDLTLNRIMDMLKFAEAKNAILLTFETGILYLIIDLYKDMMFNNPWKLIFTLPIVISIIILLISFVPNLLKTHSNESQVNLQFFGDIATLDYKKYNELLNERIINYDAFIDDLMCQIHYNAKITNKKFKAFKYAVSIFLILPFVLKIFYIVYLCVKKLIDKV